MSARKFTIGLAAAAVALAATIGSASAGEVSASEILNALKPKGATRSLSGAAPTAKALNTEDQKFLDRSAPSAPGRCRRPSASG